MYDMINSVPARMQTGMMPAQTMFRNARGRTTAIVTDPIFAGVRTEARGSAPRRRESTHLRRAHYRGKALCLPLSV